MRIAILSDSHDHLTALAAEYAILGVLRPDRITINFRRTPLVFNNIYKHTHKVICRTNNDG